MTFRDILVQVDASEAGVARARFGAQLAASFRGCASGFFIRVPRVAAVDLPVFTELGLQGGAYGEALRRLEEAEDRAQHEAERAFRAELARVRIGGDWLVLEAGSPELIDARARYADLVIVGAPGSQEPGAPLTEAFPAELALASGRPVLAIPRKSAADPVGERIFVAWNSSREAARAVNDAMPLLERARFVAALAVEPPWGEIQAGMRELSKLLLHLERHGVSGERYVVQAPEHLAGDEIIAQARRAACDLVVMGAYGHSHMREIVLGGATRTLLNSGEFPVLLSH